MKTAHKLTGGAAVIACCTVFLPNWEGTDLVAKKDAIGTGHPVTYCHGQTDEFGKVKEGTRFTPAQCSDLLGKSLPKYLNAIKPCIKVELPVKTEAALLDAAYNAGGAAVCKSPMVAKMNAGGLEAGCDAFQNWYIRASGRVVKGLINRRAGERKLCLEGLSEKPIAKPALTFWQKLKLFFLTIIKGN